MVRREGEYVTSRVLADISGKDKSTIATYVQRLEFGPFRKNEGHWTYILNCREVRKRLLQLSDRNRKFDNIKLSGHRKMLLDYKRENDFSYHALGFEIGVSEASVRKFILGDGLAYKTLNIIEQFVEDYL